MGGLKGGLLKPSLWGVEARGEGPGVGHRLPRDNHIFSVGRPSFDKMQVLLTLPCMDVLCMRPSSGAWLRQICAKLGQHGQIWLHITGDHYSPKPTNSSAYTYTCGYNAIVLGRRASTPSPKQRKGSPTHGRSLGQGQLWCTLLCEAIHPPTTW